MTDHPVIANAHAWLDEDGVHVWVSHDCTSSIGSPTMLPYPKWRAAERDGRLQVDPSVHCVACGLHGFLSIEERAS